MKTPSTATNVVTGIFAAIFSILFVISFILTTFVWAFTSMITPAGLTDFLTSDKVIDFISEDDSIEEMLANSDLPKEALGEFLDSDLATEILTSFADGMSSELLGTEAKNTYDEEYFKDLCIENKDDVMDFLSKFPEAEGLSDEEMDEAFNYFIEDVPAQLATTITEATDSIIETEGAEVIEAYEFIVNVLPVIFTVITVVFLVICFLLRIKFTYGLLWTGVTSVIAGVISFCPSMFMGSSATLIAEAAEAPFITPILTAMTERMSFISLIPLVLGIGLIVAKVLITKAKNNDDVKTDEGCIRD